MQGNHPIYLSAIFIYFYVCSVFSQDACFLPIDFQSFCWLKEFDSWTILYIFPYYVIGILTFINTAFPCGMLNLYVLRFITFCFNF